jgi:hypothetical protein
MLDKKAAAAGAGYFILDRGAGFLVSFPGKVIADISGPVIPPVRMTVLVK